MFPRIEIEFVGAVFSFIVGVGLGILRVDDLYRAIMEPPHATFQWYLLVIFTLH